MRRAAEPAAPARVRSLVGRRVGSAGPVRSSSSAHEHAGALHRVSPPPPTWCRRSWCCVICVTDYGVGQLAARGGPLDGIVVADFTRVLAGPLATMTLGDLGAEVVKVERPGTGDETRGWQPPTAASGQSTYFLAVNRNKRSIALDLSTSEGRAICPSLALDADVVVENFRARHDGALRPGLRRLWRPARPALIYASLTGFGRGRRPTPPGYDFLVQAVGGLMSVTGRVRRRPDQGRRRAGRCAGRAEPGGRHPGRAAAPRTHRPGPAGRGRPALQSAGRPGQPGIGISQRRRRAGPARQRASEHRAVPGPRRGRPAGRAGGRQRRPVPAARRRAGGRPGRRDRLADDPRFATNADRVRHVEALTAALQRALATRPAAHWVQRLGAAGVPCGAVNTVDEAFALAASLGLRPGGPAAPGRRHARSPASPARSGCRCTPATLPARAARPGRG